MDCAVSDTRHEFAIMAYEKNATFVRGLDKKRHCFFWFKRSSLDVGCEDEGGIGEKDLQDGQSLQLACKAGIRCVWGADKPMCFLDLPFRAHDRLPNASNCRLTTTRIVQAIGDGMILGASS